MAIKTCMFPVFFLLGDGAATNIIISLTKSPILFDRFTVLNFPKAVDTVTIISAVDSLNNDVLSQCSTSVSGTAVTFNFTSPFSDVRTLHTRFEFIGG